MVSSLNMFLPFNRFTTTKKGVYSLIDCQKTARNTWLKCGPQWGAFGWKTSLHVAVTHDLMTVGESDMSSVGTERNGPPQASSLAVCCPTRGEFIPPPSSLFFLRFGSFSRSFKETCLVCLGVSMLKQKLDSWCYFASFLDGPFGLSTLHGQRATSNGVSGIRKGNVDDE